MSDDARAPSDIVNLKLRLREDLRARLEASAKAEGNSLNSEIIRRLEMDLADDKRGLIETAMLGGGYNARLVRGIAALLVIANPGSSDEMSIAQRWAVRLGINHLLDALMPVPSQGDQMPQEDLEERAHLFAGLLNVAGTYLKGLGLSKEP